MNGMIETTPAVSRIATTSITTNNKRARRRSAGSMSSKRRRTVSSIAPPERLRNTHSILREIARRTASDGDLQAPSSGSSSLPFPQVLRHPPGVAGREFARWSMQLAQDKPTPNPLSNRRFSVLSLIRSLSSKGSDEDTVLP